GVGGCTSTMRSDHEWTGGWQPKYAVVDSLPVLYRKDVPAAAVVATFTELWGFALFATGGATFLLVMLAVSREARSRSSTTFHHSDAKQYQIVFCSFSDQRVN